MIVVKTSGNPLGNENLTLRQTVDSTENTQTTSETECFDRTQDLAKNRERGEGGGGDCSIWLRRCLLWSRKYTILSQPHIQTTVDTIRNIYVYSYAYIAIVPEMHVT